MIPFDMFFNFSDVTKNFKSENFALEKSESPYNKKEFIANNFRIGFTFQIKSGVIYPVASYERLLEIINNSNESFEFIQKNQTANLFYEIRISKEQHDDPEVKLYSEVENLILFLGKIFSDFEKKFILVTSHEKNESSFGRLIVKLKKEELHYVFKDLGAIRVFNSIFGLVKKFSINSEIYKNDGIFLRNIFSKSENSSMKLLPTFDQFTHSFDPIESFVCNVSYPCRTITLNELPESLKDSSINSEFYLKKNNFDEIGAEISDAQNKKIEEVLSKIFQDSNIRNFSRGKYISQFNFYYMIFQMKKCVNNMTHKLDESYIILGERNFLIKCNHNLCSQSFESFLTREALKNDEAKIFFPTHLQKKENCENNLQNENEDSNFKSDSNFLAEEFEFFSDSFSPEFEFTNPLTNKYDEILDILTNCVRERYDVGAQKGKIQNNTIQFMGSRNLLGSMKEIPFDKSEHLLSKNEFTTNLTINNIEANIKHKDFPFNEFKSEIKVIFQNCFNTFNFYNSSDKKYEIQYDGFEKLEYNFIDENCKFLIHETLFCNADSTFGALWFKITDPQKIFFSKDAFFTFNEKTNIWIKESFFLKLENKIAEDLIAFYAKLQNHLLSNNCQTKNEFIKNTIRKTILKLKQTNLRRNIFHSVKTIIPYIDPENIFDKNDHLISFRNCCFDFSKDEFRNYKKEDFITKHLNLIYEPEKIEEEKINEYLNSLFQTEEEINYFIYAMKKCLNGNEPGDFFYIWLGSGNNGKTSLCNLIKNAFCFYVKILSSSFFASGKMDPSNATPELSNLKSKRIGILTEINNKSLDQAKIKRICGNDELVSRALFQNEKEFKNTCKVIICANSFPKFEDLSDPALWRRIRIIEFNTILSENPILNEKKRNPLVDTMIKEESFHLEFIKKILTSKHKEKIPVSFQSAFTTYKEKAQSRFSDFLSSNVVFSSKNKLCFSSIFKRFKKLPEEFKLQPEISSSQHYKILKKETDAFILEKFNITEKKQGSFKLQKENGNAYWTSRDYYEDLQLKEE